MSENINDRKMTSIIKREQGVTEPMGEIRNFAAHLQHVRELERKCIAREIHDELGSELAILNMEISLLETKIPKRHKSVHDKIESISARIGRTIHTVQKIITGLRPALIDKLNLRSAIEWQIEEFQTNTGIKCDVKIDDSSIKLDKEKEIYIYRIFQEILSNITRHAEATRVEISLKENDGQLLLSVKDNGIGINEMQISNPKSFGIIGLKERVSFFGGLLSINGTKNEGTSVLISIPCGRDNTLKNALSDTNRIMSLNNCKNIH